MCGPCSTDGVLHDAIVGDAIERAVIERDRWVGAGIGRDVEQVEAGRAADGLLEAVGVADRRQHTVASERVLTADAVAADLCRRGRRRTQ